MLQVMLAEMEESAVPRSRRVGQAPKLDAIRELGPIRLEEDDRPGVANPVVSEADLCARHSRTRPSAGTATSGLELSQPTLHLALLLEQDRTEPQQAHPR